jgi:hypothetical protein
LHPEYKEGSVMNEMLNAKGAILNFSNGHGVSVLFGSGFYSNGIDTYELAVLKDGRLCYDTEITNDVMGWLSKEEVSEVMEKVQNLPKQRNKKVMKKINMFIALYRYLILRYHPMTATYIYGDAIAMGYSIDKLGTFKYPLPNFIIKKCWDGCLKWSEFDKKHDL